MPEYALPARLPCLTHQPPRSPPLSCAQVRFEAASERARAALESPDAAPLLGEHAVYVHLPEKARKLMGANAAALKRIAAVLGAKVRGGGGC